MPSEHFVPFFDALDSALPRVTFVQIGANDGVWNDPIEPYLRGEKWRGVLVEPVPYVFARLKARYGSRQNFILENCAIAESDGTRTFYSVREWEGDEASHASAIGSFSLVHVLKHAANVPDFTKRIQLTQVPCLTLRTLFAKHHITQLDALVMDAEGYDGAIVQNIPFDIVRPAVIFFEHKHLDSATREQCRTLLTQHDYLLFERHSNTLAFLNQLRSQHVAFATAWENAQSLNLGRMNT